MKYGPDGRGSIDKNASYVEPAVTRRETTMWWSPFLRLFGCMIVNLLAGRIEYRVLVRFNPQSPVLVSVRKRCPHAAAKIK